MKKRKYTDEQLIETIKKSFSLRQVLIELGLNPKGGGNYQALQNKIKELNIDTSHLKGQGWNKDRVSGPKRDIEEYLLNRCPIHSHQLRLRLIKEGYFEPRCYSCNNTEWMSNLIPLELDHIDGNHQNNNLNNLRLLCPNCHALTDNYCGKNKAKYSL